MTTETERERIRRFVIAEFELGIEPAELDDDFDLVTTGVVDSLGRYVVLEWLGREFGIPVDEIAESADVGSVRAICAVIGGHAPVPGRS